MRASAIAVIAAFGAIIAAGSADARVHTDPQGRLTFDVPNNWRVTWEQQGDFSYAVAGVADFECHFVAMPREETAARTVAEVNRAASNQFSVETWTGLANAMTPIFQNQAAVVTQSLETDRFWPLQRAELSSAARTDLQGNIHGAVQLRPGMELWTYCMTYEGEDSAARYDAMIRSVGTPNDATLQSQAEAAAAAAPPAPTAPPTQ